MGGGNLKEQQEQMAAATGGEPGETYACWPHTAHRGGSGSKQVGVADVGIMVGGARWLVFRVESGAKDLGVLTCEAVLVLHTDPGAL